MSGATSKLFGWLAILVGGGLTVLVSLGTVATLISAGVAGIGALVGAAMILPVTGTLCLWGLGEVFPARYGLAHMSALALRVEYAKRNLGAAEPADDQAAIAGYRDRPDHELLTLLQNIRADVAGPRYPALLWVIKQRVESHEAGSRAI